MTMMLTTPNASLVQRLSPLRIARRRRPDGRGSADERGNEQHLQDIVVNEGTNRLSGTMARRKPLAVCAWARMNCAAVLAWSADGRDTAEPKSTRLLTVVQTSSAMVVTASK